MRKITFKVLACKANIAISGNEKHIFPITINGKMEKDSPESNLVSLQLGKEIAELQKREDRADQLVLFFLAGANIWEKHAKNCAIMSLFWEKHAKNCAIMSLFWC